MNGYPAYCSNNVPANTILYGNFNDLIVGTWNFVDIMVDPYSEFTKGTIGVRALLDIDIGVRRAESFSKLSEAA